MMSERGRGGGREGGEREGRGAAQQESLFFETENFTRIASRSGREQRAGRRALQKESPSEQREDRNLRILRLP